jgi:hypothetical protein
MGNYNLVHRCIIYTHAYIHIMYEILVISEQLQKWWQYENLRLCPTNKYDNVIVMVMVIIVIIIIVWNVIWIARNKDLT